MALSLSLFPSYIYERKKKCVVILLYIHKGIYVRKKHMYHQWPAGVFGLCSHGGLSKKRRVCSKPWAILLSVPCPVTYDCFFRALLCWGNSFYWPCWDEVFDPPTSTLRMRGVVKKYIIFLFLCLSPSLGCEPCKGRNFLFFHVCIHRA